MYRISRSAPRVEADGTRPLDEREQRLLLPGARLVCESVQDNDLERWMLTEGGQFIRETARDIYLVGPAEALEMLAGFCDDDVMEKLVAANAFADAIRLPGPLSPS